MNEVFIIYEYEFYGLSHLIHHDGLPFMYDFKLVSWVHHTGLLCLIKFIINVNTLSYFLWVNFDLTLSSSSIYIFFKYLLNISLIVLLFIYYAMSFFFIVPYITLSLTRIKKISIIYLRCSVLWISIIFLPLTIWRDIFCRKNIYKKLFYSYIYKYIIHFYISGSIFSLYF